MSQVIAGRDEQPASDPHVTVEQAVFAYDRGARITVAQVFRTREFRTQNDPDRFGAVSLSLKF